MNKRIGKQTIEFENPPRIKQTASIVGKKEGKGPLAKCFDIVLEDDYAGENSWEMAESRMQNEAAELVFKKSGIDKDKIDYILSGDLQNQCVASHYAMRNFQSSFIGLYGACSTMVEGMMLSAMLIDGGYAENIICGTSSHFCSAEKQFRFPMEYGGIRTPTSQWTVTGSGFSYITSEDIDAPRIVSATTGKIVDLGVCDINNMGAAMAPAACDTLYNHFKATGTSPEDYDLIVTGDLGEYGSDLARELLSEKGYNIHPNHRDCGLLIYDRKGQDVHAGGSGCGCLASVFCGHIFKELKEKRLNRIILMATGALMNPQVVLQGESIPGIAHLVVLENEVR